MTPQAPAPGRRRSGPFIALGIVAVCVVSFLVNGPSRGGVFNSTSTPEGTITEQEFGEAWPFVYSSGILRCEGSDGFGAVTFEVDGRTYSVNGVASTQAERRGWNADLFSIVKDGSSVGPIIQRGLQNCR